MTKAEKAWSEFEYFVRGFENRRYEAFTLRVGKVRYTPDFSGTGRDDQVVFFEVKPSGHQATFTPVARVKLKMFAVAFPEYIFMVCWPDKKDPLGWHIEHIDNEE